LSQKYARLMGELLLNLRHDNRNGRA